MSRPGKGARLYLKPERRARDGSLRERSCWIIRDGSRNVGTGCAPSEIRKAEGKLKEYLAEKYSPVRKEQDIENILIADVLSIFIDDRRDGQENKKGFDERIGRLNAWWGSKKLSSVSGKTCREYVKSRGSDGGARRDLEDLRAAINHHAKEGLHRGSVRVWLPAKGLPRDRWLTRSEAALLIWTCWRYREMQTIHRGKNKGQKVATAKRRLQHIARFILIGQYTGTRAGAIASASPDAAVGRSYVDLERGVFYRLAQGKSETNKRQPPVPLPPAPSRTHAQMEAIEIDRATFRRVRRRGREVCKDWFQTRREVSETFGKSYAAHVASHGCDVAHAGWRRSVGGCGVSRDERGDVVENVRPPPSGSPKGRG